LQSANLCPSRHSVHTICFSPESSLLSTSGWDHVRREQIVIWDIPVSLFAQELSLSLLTHCSLDIGSNEL
jgi:hypothetical protein